MARDVVYKGKIVNLVLEDGKWEIIQHAPAVGVIVIQDGKMLFVRQLRRAIGAHTLEIPAGLIDAGEEPIEAAHRELAEEARLDGDLELVTRFYSSPGFCDELLYLFRAQNLRPAYGERDEDEDGIELVWMEPQAFLNGLRDGSIDSSGPGAAAAFFALLELGS